MSVDTKYFINLYEFALGNRFHKTTKCKKKKKYIYRQFEEGCFVNL